MSYEIKTKCELCGLHITEGKPYLYFGGWAVRDHDEPPDIWDTRKHRLRAHFCSDTCAKEWANLWETRGSLDATNDTII